MAGILASLMGSGGWCARCGWDNAIQIRFFRRRNKYLIVVCWKADPCMSLFDIASPCWVLVGLPFALPFSPKPPNRRLETSDSPTHQIKIEFKRGVGVVGRRAPVLLQVFLFLYAIYLILSIRLGLRTYGCKLREGGR
jgi:hypothetical protein